MDDLTTKRSIWAKAFAIFFVAIILMGSGITQVLTVQNNGTTVGTRQILNLIAGSNITLNPFTDASGKINVTINAAAPGTGTVTNVATGCGLSGGAITTTGTLIRSEAVNLQTGTSYTIDATDCGKLVSQTNGAAIAITLPQAGGSFPAGWFFDFQNRGAGTSTITPTTSTIDGAASLTFTTDQGARIVSDGTNYYTVRGRPSSSGGGVRTSTQAAATPTAANSLNLINNGIQMYYDTGAALQPYGPVYPFVAPASGSYTWLNQGTSTVSTTYGGINIVTQQDGGGGTATWRGQYKAVPTAPYTVDIVFSCNIASNIGNGGYCGVFWFDGTKLESAAVTTAYEKATRIFYQYWNSATSYNSNVATQNTFDVPLNFTFVRLVDDSTNHEVWISTDGAYWIRQGFATRNAWLTATHIGFGVYSDAPSKNQITLRSWYEH